MGNDYTLDKLLDAIKENDLKVDNKAIIAAFKLAEKSHSGQKRASGQDFIIHPVATAIYLANLKMDQPTIMAGLLHDVLEDTPTTSEMLRKHFGKEVQTLVEGVSNLDKLKYHGNKYYIENLRKMFVAMAKDIRVILIKFADRLHNLQTLEHLPPEKQKRIAHESLEIYAPIAHRFGLGELKGNLEDWAFRYVYPEEFMWLNQRTIELYSEKANYLKNFKKEIRNLMNIENIQYNAIYDRVKRLYSLYRKLQKYNNDFSQIYDAIALRIIVPTISDCYTCLGIIHCKYRPLKGRIKDYIAQPKPNGYKSLHTTVFADGYELIEIQIRTPEMNTEALFGIAAHWDYKANEGKKSAKIKWVQELAQLSSQLKDDPQYLETLKLDIFQNQIFILTPKGDVIELPEHSTPIDFAYHIHTEIGNKCTNAKINGRIASLDSTLKNGDIVEIITDKNRKQPNIDWLKIVKTHTAKGKIKTALNKYRRAQIRNF